MYSSSLQINENAWYWNSNESNDIDRGDSFDSSSPADGPWFVFANVWYSAGQHLSPFLNYQLMHAIFVSCATGLLVIFTWSTSFVNVIWLTRFCQLEASMLIPCMLRASKKTLLGNVPDCERDQDELLPFSDLIIATGLSKHKAYLNSRRNFVWSSLDSFRLAMSCQSAP